MVAQLWFAMLASARKRAKLLRQRTGSLIWWFGGNQQVGMAIFFAGGILWFVAQKIQSIEDRVKKAEEAQAKNKSDQPKSGANPS